jgi:hypothetical protein
MSNCHIVAGRSLIDWAASRLALRAPALRAATALTRPNRSAQRLACRQHTVPTAKTVGPHDVAANHRIERVILLRITATIVTLRMAGFLQKLNSCAHAWQS